MVAGIVPPEMSLVLIRKFQLLWLIKFVEFSLQKPLESASLDGR